jgi:peptide/nickel transport system substrate-binding protein
MDSSPFDDRRVRDAMRYAVDRQALIDVAFFGQGQISCDSPLPPGSRYRKDVGVCERDVEKAKQLLADAGYPDGLSIEMWTISDRAGFVPVALAFQDQAKEANINIEVRSVPASIYWSEKWLSVPFGMCTWAPRPTSDAQIRVAYTCGAKWNDTSFCSEELDSLLDQALAEGDEAKRQELYTGIQEIIATEGGTIIPFFYPRLAAHRSNVMNFVAHATAEHDLEEVWLAPET